MNIKKKYERLVNIGNFENVKIGVEIDSDIIFKEGATGTEKASAIKSKGVALGKIAQTMVDEEVKQMIEKLKEKANGGEE